MPAKVIEPNGNSMGAPSGFLQCGYLVRADVPVDSQKELKRIPFINDNKKRLKEGDLVMIDEIQPFNAVIVTSDASNNVISAPITIAKIAPEHFETNWNSVYKSKWDDKWNKVDPAFITTKLQLKPGTDRKKILACKGKPDVDGISLI